MSTHHGRFLWCELTTTDARAAEAAAARVKENVGQVLTAPREAPGNLWFIQRLDPQGIMFAAVSPRR
jgi:predicted enzyme related to lactoylglutathione lyase